ncbi:hypothetical protein [Halalkalibacter alkalisediminis]|uniref:Uncharacterized protein n=1 Tax=Halalkalibacter alkalisediminis TaxID=935616 RepID=A0ABV6NJA5_9BACI|nr:hypothetical protein [Halalkalibacter alkalisediminis]
MRQKKIWIPAGILLVTIGIFYYFFHSEPPEFLTTDALVETINSYQYGTDSIEIQDMVFLGETHVFVPFVSNKEYGTSYWVWRNRSWELGGITTIQDPYVWKVDPGDPSTYVVVWNMNRDSDMKEFDIYLLNQRGYSVSHDVHHYTPRVQLDFTVPFETEEHSYGVKPLPDEWVTFLQSFVKVEQSPQPDSFFNDFFQPSSVNFGWMPYDENGEVSFPSSPNGSGHQYGEIHLEHLSSIPEYELE